MATHSSPDGVSVFPTARQDTLEIRSQIIQKKELPDQDRLEKFSVRQLKFLNLLAVTGQLNEHALPKLISARFETDLKPMLGLFGFDFGPIWGRVRAASGSIWGRFGCRCWGRFRIDSGPVRKAFPTLPSCQPRGRTFTGAAVWPAPRASSIKPNKVKLEKGRTIAIMIQY